MVVTATSREELATLCRACRGLDDALMAGSKLVQNHFSTFSFGDLVIAVGGLYRTAS